MRGTSTTRHLIRTSAVLVTLGLAASARADNMQTTGSLPAGHLSLGAGLEAAIGNDNPMLLNLHQTVGLAGGTDLYVREGIGLDDQPFLIGAGIKWTILGGRRDRPGVALLLGGHYYVDNFAGADATIFIDYTIGRVTPFLGLDSAIDFPENGTDFKLGFDGGVRIGLVQNVAWFVEGGIGLTGEPKPTYIATGPRFSIN